MLFGIDTIGILFSISYPDSALLLRGIRISNMRQRLLEGWESRFTPRKVQDLRAAIGISGVVADLGNKDPKRLSGPERLLMGGVEAVGADEVIDQCIGEWRSRTPWGGN